MKRLLEDSQNEGIKSRNVKRIETKKKTYIFFLLIVLIAGCGSSQTHHNHFATYPTFKVFNREYHEVWEAVLESLKDYRLIRTEKDIGYIKSALIENNLKERFEFEIHVKRQSRGNVSVTISSYIQRYQEGVGWKKITSNTTLEYTILTKIEKFLKKKGDR